MNKSSTPEKIRHMYHVERKSTVQISRELKIHTDTVRSILNHHPSGIRSLKEAAIIRSEEKRGHIFE